MKSYQKIRKGLYIGCAIFPAFLSAGCIAPEGREGDYNGHDVTARDMGQAKIVWIDGKAGGRLRAEDRSPFGNWDGLEDEMTLTGVSEADSLYGFVYPEMLREAYEELWRRE